MVRSRMLVLDRGGGDAKPRIDRDFTRLAGQILRASVQIFAQMLAPLRNKSQQARSIMNFLIQQCSPRL